MKKNLIILVSSLLILVLSTSTSLSCFASSDDSSSNPAVDAVTNDDDITVTDATYDPSAADPSQYDVYSPSSITPLPGGGESINFIINGVVNSYLVPPNNFNPKKATDEQLAEYGLPPRPSDPTLLKDWEKEIKNFKHAVKPLKAYIKKNTFNTTYSTTHSTWAGTIDCVNIDHISSGANSTEGLFQCVNGSWTQPTISCPDSTYAETTWVGIGGYFNNTGGLLQCGTSYETYDGYQAWYEYLSPSMANPIVTLPVKVAANNSIQAIVCYNGANANFTVSVNGAFTTISVQNASNYYYGGTAEWIVERQMVRGVTSNLASFNLPSNKLTFTGCNAYTNRTNVGSTVGVTYPMNTFTEIQLSMQNGSTTLAHPDASSYTADSFTVCHN